MRFEVQNVVAMPQILAPGVLYVSREFETAHHLCACGCGHKVRTPLSPAEWQVFETPQGVTMHPSIGSWQVPCKSHYLIQEGEVVWAVDGASPRLLRAELGTKESCMPT